MRKVYRKYAENQGGGVLRKKDLQTAVKVVNARYARYYQTWLEENGDPEEIYDFEDFREVIETFREMVRDTFRAYLGFTQEELKPFQVAFDKRQPDADGTLSEEKVGDLFTDLIPSLGWDSKLRDLLRTAVRTNNATSKPLNFIGFLKVMRDFKDKFDALQDASAPWMCEELGIRWRVADEVLEACNDAFFGREKAPSLWMDHTVSLLYGSGPTGQSIRAEGLTAEEMEGLRKYLCKVLLDQQITSLQDFVVIVTRVRKLALSRLAEAAAAGYDTLAVPVLRV